MQRMSRGRDQWPLNAHRLDSLNHVTTRSNGQESFRSRTRSSTRVNLEISFFFFFWREIFFEENSNDIFLNTFFFGSKYVPSSKKVQKKTYEKPTHFSKELFFWEAFFFVWKTQKRWKTPEKTELKKKKKQKNTNAKSKRTNEK